jgi:hypothetical protein
VTGRIERTRLRRFCLLVVAKAPVPGLAKTRLCPPATPEQAAEIAAAALLDTLNAVAQTPGAQPMVALTGDLTKASRSAELTAALRSVPVIVQRGNNFSDRLANAHADVARLRPYCPVLQIGMDTPQVTPALLAETADLLIGSDAVLGPATDGGWWALGLRDPGAAAVLSDVPMSRSDTGCRTMECLEADGNEVTLGVTLSDVDTMADARAVAAKHPGATRFAAAVRAVRAEADLTPGVSR